MAPKILVLGGTKAERAGIQEHFAYISNLKPAEAIRGQSSKQEKKNHNCLFYKINKMTLRLIKNYSGFKLQNDQKQF